MSQGGVDQWTQSGGTAVSLFVAQWEANQGKADAVVAKLRRFLPQAQSEPNVKLFLIGQGNDNPAQLLFCELFESQDAFRIRQASTSRASWRDKRFRFFPSENADDIRFYNQSAPKCGDRVRPRPARKGQYRLICAVRVELEVSTWRRGATVRRARQHP